MTLAAPNSQEQYAAHLPALHLLCNIGWNFLTTAQALAMRGSTREVLLRHTPLVRGGWLAFLAWCVVFAFGAFWELLEWWTTLLVASDLGQAFLGSQGDVWDAQWDMFLVGVGGAVSLALMGKVHDRSMARVPAWPAS